MAEEGYNFNGNHSEEVANDTVEAHFHLRVFYGPWGTAFLILLIVTSVVGNSLCLFAYRDMAEEARTKLMTVLAGASLTVGLGFFPVIIINNAVPDLPMTFTYWCQVSNAIQMESVILFLTNLSLVAVWNYVQIVYPLRSPSWIYGENLHLVSRFRLGHQLTGFFHLLPH